MALPWPGNWPGGPAGVFFGVVAGLAEALAVAAAGGPVVVPGDDVVVMPDRGVAVGGTASVVTDLQEASECRREEPGLGIHRDQFTAARGSK